MRPFLVWLCCFAVVFGVTSTSYHYHRSLNPKRVAVVVDSSFSMRSAQSDIPTILGRLESRRYASYSLFTEKNRVHSWSSALVWIDQTAYAPRDFSSVVGNERFTELDQADERVIVTNADETELGAFTGWKIVRP